MSTVYLAGPMAAHTDFNYAAFDTAADTWRAFGWTVYSPHENFGGDKTLARDLYLQAAMQQVLKSRAVAVLPDWTKSRGALLEVMVAAVIGLPIYDATQPFYADDDWEAAFAAADPFGEYLAEHMDDSGWLPHLLAKDYGGQDAGESVLLEADRLINGPRQADYSHPSKDFEATANLWMTYINHRYGDEPATLGPEDVAIMMILLKVSREAHKHKRDNLVDIAGYAGCLQMVHQWKGNH